jgi:hypothetical protein
MSFRNHLLRVFGRNYRGFRSAHLKQTVDEIIANPESTDWLGLIELGALEAAGMGADGRQGVERLRSPVKGPCEIKAR